MSRRQRKPKIPRAAIAAIAVLAAAGTGLGWPLGAVAVAGCLILPLVIVKLLEHLLMRPARRRLDVRQPLRVTAIRMTPPRKEVTDAGQLD